jgi:hypothetical protein
MAWPADTDYIESIQNPKLSFDDNDLRSCRAQTNKLGLPMPRSGNFATVYRMDSATQSWAVRCFRNEVNDQETRYSLISKHLETHRLPYFISFNYLDRGIKVKNQWYPILKMEWVNGDSLISYLEKALNNPTQILSLAKRWLAMMTGLRAAAVGHGDLQHGNIIIANGEFKLVDYDGMFIPSLAGLPGRERGHRNYQHPLRTEWDFGPNIDNFSAWLIYISLIALSVQPQLWRRFNGGDECILFRKSDLEQPDKSALFKALLGAGDAQLRSATEVFTTLLSFTPQQVPSIDGQFISMPPTSPAPSSGGSWITDHSRAGTSRPEQVTTNSTSGTSQSSFVPWFIDYQPLPSIPSTSFSKPTFGERLALLLPSFLALLTIAGSIIGQISLLLTVAVILELAFISIAILFRYYCRDPIITEFRTLSFRFQGAERANRSIEDSIGDAEKSKAKVMQAHANDLANFANQANGIKKAERDEITKIQTSLGTTIADIRKRRLTFSRQESDELSRLGKKTTEITNQIAKIKQTESAEITNALTTLQHSYLDSYLRNTTIANAKITGIGSTYKSRLISAGIRSAADISWNVTSIKGIGTGRAANLVQWRQNLEAYAHQNMPQTLPGMTLMAIRNKYSQQIKSLELQLAAETQQQDIAAQAIKVRFNNLRAPLDNEEASANAKAQKESLRANERRAMKEKEIQGAMTTLDNETKEKTKAIDEQIGKFRRELFTSILEKEKLNRRLQAYKNVTFLKFVKRHIIA